MAVETEAGESTRQRWFSRGVAGIGGASLLADLGHEVPTSLLPSLLTSVLHAPASALGLIEGIADGGAGLANFAGGTLSDDPGRHRRIAVRGRLRRLMVGVLAFELGNAAATLLILRVTDLFGPGHSETAATQLALVLYVLTSTFPGQRPFTASFSDCQ